MRPAKGPSLSSREEGGPVPTHGQCGRTACEVTLRGWLQEAPASTEKATKTSRLSLQKGITSSSPPEAPLGTTTGAALPITCPSSANTTVRAPQVAPPSNDRLLTSEVCVKSLQLPVRASPSAIRVPLPVHTSEGILMHA